MLSTRFLSRVSGFRAKNVPNVSSLNSLNGANSPFNGFGAMCSVTIRFFSVSSGQENKLFDKILIANRGEIACRVIKTCKNLGIKTVAIYSEPDAQSLHVRMADEAVCVGPAASSESYLNMDAILDAIKQTGAQAVHPGYGFLSENSVFQGKLEKVGVKFIGPRQHAIESMGDKIASKKIAKAANVNIIPGYIGEISEDELLGVAQQVGYPVMIKASAGGGGKGMRVAWNDEEAVEGFRLSKAEAISSFGDDTIFLEKFIEDPRHIEIQVLCDAHGNGLWVNERECSIQRRNQKVIEEAPSIFLDDATRKTMGEQAVALAKAVDYESAGTVEFIIDKNRQFYFLEMNTRLQVEHPVTEYITGIDLVEQMIRVAAGSPLAIKQEDIGIKGWSVESRVYAEDALKGFLPSIGHLNRYQEPDQSQGDVRVDTGVREGAEISIHYDPLICKLITHGANRDEAIAKMKTALDTYVIRGVTSNINFLRAIMDNPRFLSGDINTKFIEDEYPDGFEGIELDQKETDALICAGIAATASKLRLQSSIAVSESFDEDSFEKATLERMVVRLADKDYTVAVQNHFVDADESFLELTINDGDTTREASARSNYTKGCTIYTTEVAEEKFITQIVEDVESTPYTTLSYKGTNFKLRVLSERNAELYEHMPLPVEVDTSKMVLTPMPGKIVSVNVEVGDKVFPGMEVCVIEAMKMQNAIRAVGDSVVKAIHISTGQTVETDAVLIEFE